MTDAESELSDQLDKAIFTETTEELARLLELFPSAVNAPIYESACDCYFKLRLLLSATHSFAPPR